MEDEDSESRLVDTWTLWEEAYYKEASIESSLAQINHSNVSSDDTEDHRENCFYSNYAHESNGNGNSDPNLKNVIEGLRKNILHQTQENETHLYNDTESTQQIEESNYTESVQQEKETNITECAQKIEEINDTDCIQVEESNETKCLQQAKQINSIECMQQEKDSIDKDSIDKDCTLHGENINDTKFLQQVENTNSTECSQLVEESNDTAQTQQVEGSDDTESIQQIEQSNDEIQKEKDKTEVKIEKMAEYTQYLGLQPASSKSECNKCNSSENTSSTSEFNPKQCNCSLEMAPTQEPASSSELRFMMSNELLSTSSFSPPINTSDLSPSTSYKELPTITSSDVPPTCSDLPTTSTSDMQSTSSFDTPSTSSSVQPSISSEMPSTSSEGQSTSQSSNFKRKVYLCAACGTYFKNWNLFLHMREVHQRHICLFCLGMFGQADRLSHHLAKKHGIPELACDSLEDFYKEFQGPCFVVCCSCEKIFSETDNFYNHFCPPKENEQSSDVCSVCRQVGSHMKTCSLAPEKNNEADVSQHSISTSKPLGVTSLAPSQTITGVRRHSTRTIKPNRLNDDVYLYTKLTNIRAKRTKSQSVSESSETSESLSLNLQKDIPAASKEIKQDKPVDSVTETIMQVSKSLKDSDSNQGDKHTNNVPQNISPKNVNDSKSLSSDSAKNIYDSVTETIMEVSRCVNNSNIITNKLISDKNNVVNAFECGADKGTVESADPKSEDDVRLSKENDEAEETKDFGMESNTINDACEDTNSDSESHASDSSSSHENQPLLSPIQIKQETPDENNEDSSIPEEDNKSSATPTSDRLVIKICTKNNSMFSISTPSSHRKSSTENQVNPRESEENNNGEVSNSNSAVPEVNDDDVKEEPFRNEQDNDSDSDKLAVVDTSEDEKDAGTVTIEPDDKENESELALNNVNDQLENQLEQFDEQDKQIINTSSDKIELSDGILLAGEEIPLTDLNVDGLLETMEIEDILKLCIQAVCAVCVYCNHARHIAVNGKQLSLHMLAEHRFQPQHPAIIIQHEQFTTKVKKCLQDLESYYFNLDSFNSKEGTYSISALRVYECFQCRFYSSAHKELYLHNRKMHQKPILICIMCKSTFYSYSELLCHLCPGVYAANANIKYRCCLCTLSNLPSAFRLMVHLRKKHHACDVCLESTGNQQRLSNHVWKHKLHHMCYRCGIAYRNKPDITKHLFWKHGTESILCKKCLQKKWPHIYHFCIPPATFTCEDCEFNFSRAVALKVHKRIHTGDFPYSCSECCEKFISKKLLAKHERSHREPSPPSQDALPNAKDNQSYEDVHVDVCGIETKEDNIVEGNTEVTSKEPVKKVVDVYDLPPLNLSSDSDSDDEKVEDEKLKENEADEKINNTESELVDKPETTLDSQITIGPIPESIVEVERNEEEKKQEEQIMDGIWDNFKSYTASLEKHDSSAVPNMGIDFTEKQDQENAQSKEESDPEILRNMALADHDYCVIYSDKVEDVEKDESPNRTTLKTDDSQIKPNSDSKPERTPSPNLINKQNTASESPKKKVKSPKKKKQNASASSSDSSSDSDSSSCSCGTNCSCSSSSSSGSSSSSSSSDSDSSASASSPRKVKKKKEKDTVKEEAKSEIIENVQEVKQESNKIEKIEPVAPVQLVIVESDLDTTETETDEDFYDENPQQLANKLIAEKRQKLMMLAAGPDSMDSSVSTPVNNGIIATDTTINSPPRSPVPDGSLETTPVNKKIKTRKRKRGARGRGRGGSAKTVESIKLNIPKAMYQKKESTPKAATRRRHSASNFTTNQSIFEVNQMMSATSPGLSQSVGGSGSETDAKRSSKRKRVPKRFYGDSSDEENHRQQMLKWRRVDIPPSAKNPLPSTSKALSYQQTLQQQQQLLLQQQQEQQQLLLQQQHQQQQLLMQQQQQQLLIQQQQLQLQQERLLQQQRQQQQPEEEEDEEEDDEDDDEPEEERALVIAASGSDTNNEAADSSSDSSDSDNEIENKSTNTAGGLTHVHYPQLHPPNPERSNNLYCYCQCPYDEVSEMIACDGDDCQIEWFHFECVGIMVPPKGKWYCPDCRRKLGIPDDDVEDFANG